MGCVRGFPRKTPGKSRENCWKIFTEPRNATNSRISGHEQILLYNLGFLDLQCYFGEAVCTGLFRTDFLHGFSARTFCTDFLHGFSARIFCTDVLQGFSAQIFCTAFCPIFLRGFLHGLFVQMLHGFLHGFFWGLPKHLLGSTKISPRKSPEKFTMLWGPSGEGLGRQEGEVRLWPA